MERSRPTSAERLLAATENGLLADSGIKAVHATFWSGWNKANRTKDFARQALTAPWLDRSHPVVVKRH
jgi:hypothetical protein